MSAAPTRGPWKAAASMHIREAVLRTSLRGVDTEEAFDRLRTTARTRRVKVVEVAEEILRDGRLEPATG